jgi:hypothetical protein
MGGEDAGYWIEKLRLEAHPEGGYFRQTYRSDMVLAREWVPVASVRFDESRRQQCERLVLGYHPASRNKVVGEKSPFNSLSGFERNGLATAIDNPTLDNGGKR